MPSFLGSSTSASGFDTAFPGVPTLTTGDARLLSYYCDSSASNAAFALDNNFYQRESIGSITAITPETTNTRSQTPTSTYGSGVADGVTIHTLFQIKTPNGGWVKWIPAIRYRPVALGVDNNNEALVATHGLLSTSGTAYIENTPVSTTRIARRTTRRGAWWTLGTDSITRQTKSGSGAFTFIRPNFDRNISYVDPSAWKIGPTTQHWNLNLYGAPPVVVTRRRAAIF